MIALEFDLRSIQALLDQALAEEAKAELISVVEESPDSASAHREGVEGNLHDQDSPPVAED